MFSNAVLVVEDDPLIKSRARQAFEDCDFEVYEASSAAEAILLIRRLPEIGALISDVELDGGISGMSLAEHVRLLWPEIPIIVVSGPVSPEFGDLPERTRFLQAPLTDWLLADLSAAIREELRWKSSQNRSRSLQ